MAADNNDVSSDSTEDTDIESDSSDSSNTSDSSDSIYSNTVPDTFINVTDTVIVHDNVWHDGRRRWLRQRRWRIDARRNYHRRVHELSYIILRSSDTDLVERNAQNRMNPARQLWYHRHDDQAYLAVARLEESEESVRQDAIRLSAEREEESRHTRTAIYRFLLDQSDLY